MAKYAFSRLLAVIPVLVILSILAFGLMHMAHGDPAVAMYGGNIEKMRESDQERIRENLGLNQPLPIQYFKWLSGALQGDLGVSYLDGRPVLELIQERIPATLLLFFSSVCLGWLPSAGMNSLGQEGDWLDLFHHLILPAVVLSVSHLGGYIRFLRSSMLEVMSQDYIKAARAKGIPKRIIIYTHALKNALLPFITYLGLSLPGYFAGTFVVEAIFAWPGMGELAMEAARDRNYSVLMGTILFSGLLVTCSNLLVDLFCFLADPRIRYREIKGHWRDVSVQ